MNLILELELFDKQYSQIQAKACGTLWTRIMKVRLKGKDGGDVVCRINNRNYDPERMEIIDEERHLDI